MRQSDSPPRALFNPALYSSLVCDHTVMLFGRRRTLVVRLYAGIVGDALRPGDMPEAARDRYRAFVRARGGEPPADEALRQIEDRSIPLQRLQGAWMLLWAVLLPAVYPAFVLVRNVLDPRPWTLFATITTPLIVIFVTTLLITLGLFVHSTLHRPFTRFCARLLGIPGSS